MTFLAFNMALFTYHFIDLSKAEKHVRRQTLDKYALYAQLSALLPVLVILIFRLVKRVLKSEASGRKYSVVPSSPVQKQRQRSSTGTWSSRFRRAQWWLGEDVVVANMVLGQRDRKCSLALGLGTYSRLRYLGDYFWRTVQ